MEKNDFVTQTFKKNQLHLQFAADKLKHRCVKYR